MYLFIRERENVMIKVCFREGNHSEIYAIVKSLISYKHIPWNKQVFKLQLQSLPHLFVIHDIAENYGQM